MKSTMYVEFQGEKTDVKQIENGFKQMWLGKGKKIKDVENVELYYKPEEKTCYYSIPGSGETGSFGV